MIPRMLSLSVMLMVGVLLMGFSANLWAQSPPSGDPPPQEIDNPPPPDTTPDNPPPSEATPDNPPPDDPSPDSPPPVDNQPPTLTVPGAQTVNEGATLTFTVTATDTDEGQLVRFSATDLPEGATFDVDTGAFSWTPTLTQAGTYTVSFTATDNGAPPLSDGPKSVTITVNSVNQAPSFTKGPDQTVNEDTGAQAVNGWATEISAGPADESTQTLTFEVTNDNNTLFSSQPAISMSGEMTYTPAPNASGSATVTVSLKDDGGTANGGVDTSPAQTFTITVTPVNDAPTLTAIPDPAAILEDAGAQTISLSGIGAGAANETQALAVTATSGNAALIPNPTVTYTSSGATGSLGYTPVPNASGTATITVTVQDNGGTLNGGVDTVIRTFTVTVTPVNDAPSFTAGGNQTVFEDAGPQAVSGWATNLSAGPANESSQTLDFIVTNNNNALFSAQPSVDASGKLMYTTALNANGSATVTVKIHDNGGTANDGVDTSPAQAFTITVNPVNDPPVADAGPAQTVNENTGVTLHGSGSDVDAGNVLSFAWTQTGGPSVTLSGANTQTPTFTAPFVPMDQTVVLTFRLVVTDNGSPSLSSQPSTVTVTVKDVYNAMYLSVHGASSIRKDLRDEDVMFFRRDDDGDVIASTLARFFDGSQYFKSNEALDGVEVGEFDGDAELELIFSVRSKAKFKMGSLEVRPGDLVLYNPSSNPKFTRFLNGSKVFADQKPGRDRDDDDDDDDDGDSRENIDGVSVHKTGSSWKVFLTTTGKAQIGTLSFDKNDVIQIDFDPSTSTASNPVRILDANSLFKGKQTNIDALDVVDDDGNGTLESIAFSTGSSEKLKDGREIKASVVYAYNRETNAVDEVFDPVGDELSRGRVPIGSVSFIGPLRPWGTGPKPVPASKPKGKGHALMAKVGEEAPEVPQAFGLEQSYPNPFNPATTIRYALPEAANVSLVVYNLLGQQVRTLVSGAQGPGYHSVVWDGRDEAGHQVATGMYIYRLQAGTFVQVRKMLFAK